MTKKNRAPECSGHSTARIWAETKHISTALEATVERTDRNLERLTRLIEPVRLLTQLSLGITESENPTVLSEIGKRISEDIQGETLAADFIPVVAPQVRGWLPHDIQQYAFYYIYDQVAEDPKFWEYVRLVASGNNVIEWVIVDVISFEVRDAVLKLDNQ